MSSLTSLLILGGARSGKSSVGEKAALAASVRLQTHVSVVVTAVAIDEEMQQRIDHHRLTRPSNWNTIEAPYALDDAVRAAQDDSVLLIDCVTVWLSNLLVQGDELESIEAKAEGLAVAIAARHAPTIVISNEVGSGVVPVEPLGRVFRDLQGRANQTLAAHLDTSVLVVAGQVLTLAPAGSFWEQTD